jgi:hypothetical protein
VSVHYSIFPFFLFFIRSSIFFCCIHLTYLYLHSISFVPYRCTTLNLCKLGGTSLPPSPRHHPLPLGLSRRRAEGTPQGAQDMHLDNQSWNVAAHPVSARRSRPGPWPGSLLSAHPVLPFPFRGRTASRQLELHPNLSVPAARGRTAASRSLLGWNLLLGCPRPHASDCRVCFQVRVTAGNKLSAGYGYGIIFLPVCGYG